MKFKSKLNLTLSLVFVAEAVGGGDVEVCAEGGCLIAVAKEEASECATVEDEAM